MRLAPSPTSVFFDISPSCFAATLLMWGGPRFLALSRFALGKIDRNIVSLAIDKDWTYQDISQHMSSLQYAAHGGLLVYGHKKTGAPKGFHSTLSVGPLPVCFLCQVELVWTCRSLVVPKTIS